MLVKTETSAIICGDAVVKLPDLLENSIDFIFTDPPYGLKIARTFQIAGDEVANDLFSVFVNEATRILKPGACLCCCCGGGGSDEGCVFADWTTKLLNTPKLKFKQMVIWDKGPMGIGWHYRRSYETILVAQKSGAKCRWYDTSHRIENVVRHIRKVPTQSKNKHPAEKPVLLAAYFIKLHTQPSDIVLDPFCGHGSTGVAAVNTKRQFLGIDIEPKYCEMAKWNISQAEHQGKLF